MMSTMPEKYYLILICTLLAITTGLVYASDKATGVDSQVVLQDYLQAHKLKREDWDGSQSGLMAKKKITDRDDNNKPIQFTRTIDLVEQDVHQSETETRHAFIVQDARTEDDADYPERDSYACNLFVYRLQGGQWRLEHKTQFLKSEYAGGTRWARDCAGFAIGWQNNLPVLTRTEVYGPYAGGQYVKSTEQLSMKNGKFKLETVESEEGDLESLEEQNQSRP